MFNFFKKNKIAKDTSKTPDYEIELTAAVLAYEIARSDGEISKNELALLMKEIELIAKKARYQIKRI